MNYCVIAFSGELPVAVFNLLPKNEVKILSVYGYSNIDNSCSIYIGQIGKLLKFLKVNKINKIFLLGSLKRPTLSNIKFDLTGLYWYFLLRRSFKYGDNKLLEHIVKLFNKNGIEVCALNELSRIKENLFIEESYKGTLKPNKTQYLDIQKGVEILKSLSKFDIGQAIVIENGLVIAIEAIEGTENLISRTSMYKRNNNAVLIKMPKIGQTNKVDLPAIGIDTVEQAKRAGISGIAIDFENCIVLNKSLVLQKMHEYGMFLFNVKNL